MAVGVDAGVINDNTYNTEGRRVRDVASKLFMLEPDAAPLCSLLMNPKVGSTPAKSTKVEWLESRLLPRVTTLAEGIDTTETGWDVATGTGAYFRPGDVVLNTASGERALVVSISSDTLTVKRGLGTGTYGTSGVISIGNTDQLMRVANAAAQGATLGEIRQVQYTNGFNYTQIVRTAGGITRTGSQVEYYGGQEPGTEKLRKAIEHKVELEHNLFFGARQLDTSGSQPLQTMGGILSFATTNVFAAVGTLTEKLWNEYLISIGRYGSGQKVIFCSPKVAECLNSFVASKLHPDSSGPDVKDYGVSINKWLSPQGDTYGLVIKKDWADFSTSGADSPGGMAVVVDMDNVQLRPLQTTLFMDKREANDEDSKKYEYLTEQSFQVTLEQTHGVISGITGY